MNESRNFVWLSGYVRGGDENHVLLYQSSNEDRAIPIQVSTRIRRPRANTPCEIKCHAFGYRDENGRHWIRLEAIQIKRASVTSTPRRLVAMNALRPKSALQAKDYSPFVSLEQLKAEVKQTMSIDEEFVDSLLADASKRNTVRDSFQNKAVLSGFIGHKAYFPPADDGSGDLGHIRFNLLQQGDADRALQIRVQGAQRNFSKELKTLYPVVVIATVRTEVDKDDEGNITDRRVFLITERAHVGYATVNDFAGKTFPAWWQATVAKHYAESRQRADASREANAGAKTQAKAAATTSAIAAAASEAAPVAVPEGVQESSDVF